MLSSLCPLSRIRRLLPLALGCAWLGGAGCDGKKAGGTAPSASSSAAVAPGPTTLTPEQAALVLAKVGDRTVTLGDYAAALERMNPFERLRYQSADRRRLLLEEMIDVELLAQEARRRGLDRSPETEARFRQMLRDELERRWRASVPAPEEVPLADVRKYYDEHRAEFDEPERRRVSHIVTASAARAKSVLEQAQGRSAAEWGKLVEKHSLDTPPKSEGPIPVELAGDLGIVGPPAHPRGANPRVPEAVRAAAFRIAKPGDVLGEVVAEGGRFHVVRLTGRTEPRSRSFAEAERSIRVRLVEKLAEERLRREEAALRTKYPVTVDDAALAKLAAEPPAGQGGGGAR